MFWTVCIHGRGAHVVRLLTPSTGNFSCATRIIWNLCPITLTTCMRSRKTPRIVSMPQRRDTPLQERRTRKAKYRVWHMLLGSTATGYHVIRYTSSLTSSAVDTLTRLEPAGGAHNYGELSGIRIHALMIITLHIVGKHVSLVFATLRIKFLI